MDDAPDPPVELVTTSEIARRLHLTRSQAAALVGDRSFPTALRKIYEQPVWAWSDVAAWSRAARYARSAPPSMRSLADDVEHGCLARDVAVAHDHLGPGSNPVA